MYIDRCGEPEGTTFTVISDIENDADWPHGRRTVVSVMAGDLARKIRLRAGVHEATPVVITEEAFDGGWSEFTQETDYEFTLHVGEQVINLPWAYNRIDALSKWLSE